mmetsp:Transcript_125078/g.350267  ORF Transcript_125078/g.350267 Transcript_125078/m.350267 type:complete len:249 (+) Transcript_125078:2-748(+)
MIFCLIGRAIATFPLASLTNCIKNTALRKRSAIHRHLLKWQHIVMMWHAGLRGGIALVLTLQLGDWVDHVDGAGTRESLRNATLIVICAFLLVFGGTTELLLTALDIPMRGEGVLEHVERGNTVELYSRFNTFANAILVGGHPECQEPSVPVLQNVLNEAGGVVAEDGLSRVHSSRSDVSFSERYELFGMQDPTHSAEVGPERRRRTGGIFSQASGTLRPTTAESQEDITSGSSDSSLDSIDERSRKF